MRNGNHQVRGIVFVAACVLIAFVAHLLISGGLVDVSRAGSDRSVIANADDIADNLDAVADDPAANSQIDQGAVADEASATDAPATPSEQTADQSDNKPDRGPCAGILKADVAGLDDPEAHLSKGDVIKSVTVFVHDTSGGIPDAFCSGDDKNCYPASQQIDGVNQHTIELPFCQVTDEPIERRGTYEIYRVQWPY